MDTTQHSANDPTDPRSYPPAAPQPPAPVAEPEPEQSGKPKSKSKGGQWIGAIVLAVVLFFVGKWIIDAYYAPHVPTGGEAYAACQLFAEDRLKAPSTADWPSTDFTATRYGTAWRVEAYVDAENSFGAKLRTPVVCVLSFDGDNWHAEQITVE